jgi:hypothetical protein
MSSWGQALTVVGYAVGTYFGYPQLGAIIGGIVGAQIDGPTEIEGQKQDVRAPKITYGGTRPRIYGRARLAGFLAYCSDKIEVAHEEEQGKGPSAVSTTYTYKVNCIFLLAERTEATVGQPIGITRIWRNGDLIWTALTESGDDSITASQQTDAWEELTFLDGAPDQMPVPFYEADVGTENAMAYRWSAGAAIQGLDCGPTGQLPMLEFEVVTAGTSDGGAALTILQSYFDGSTTDISAYERGAATTVVATTGFVSAIGGVLQFAKPAEEPDGEVTAYWQQPGLAPDGGDLTFEMFITWTASANVAYTQVASFIPAAATPGDHYTIGFYGAGGRVIYDNGDFGEGYISPLGFPGALHVAMVWSSTGHRVYFNGQKVYELTGDKRLPPHDGDGLIRFGKNSSVEGYNFAVDSFRLRREEVYTGNSFAPPDEIPPPDGPTTRITPATVDLAEVVKSEWLRCGTLSDDVIDVSDLEGVEVRGVVATGTAAEVTGRLSQAYYFDVYCNDKLRAKRRGSSPVADIAFRETGVAEGQPGQPFTGLKRENEIEQPAQVIAGYTNIAADYEPGAEPSDRLVTPSSEVRQLSLTNVVLTPEEAKGRAITWARDARSSSHTGSLSVSDAYAKVDCADVHTVTDHEGTQWRVRVLRTNDSGGVRTFEVCMDDANAIVEEGVTSNNYTPSVTVSAKGDTTLVVMDLPLLRDADDTTGEYVATKIEGGAGTAARVFKSADGTSYGSVVTVTDEAVIGEAAGALGDWTGGDTFDERNSVTVDVGDGTLSSSTRDAILADSTVNAFALGADGRWEVGQFRTATLVSPGVYKLTGFLRGRKGTEWATGTHEAGDKFVRLSTSGVRRVSLTNEELGLQRYWKGVTIGKALSSAAAQTQTPMGVSKKPRSPVDLRVSTDSSGDKSLTWKRRTRLTDRFVGALGSSVPLGEASESYQVRIYADGTFTSLVATYDSTAQSLSYTAAQQATDFGVEQATIYWGVCQRSETVGLGYEALSDGSSRTFPTSSSTSSGSGGGSGSFRGPKIAALDYRTGTGAFNATMLSKYDIVILGMLPSQAEVGGAGYNCVVALKAAKPNIEVFQYTIITQTFHKSTHPAYETLSDALDAMGGWAYDAATGLKTKTNTVLSYDAWEVNISDYAAADGSGFKPSEVVANWNYANITQPVYGVGLTGVFRDNTWGAPGSTTSGLTYNSAGTALAAGKCGDYNLDSSNDSLGLVATTLRSTSPAPSFRLGHARAAARERVLHPGAKLIANADSDNVQDATYGKSSLATPELTGVFNYAFLEGVNGKSYSFESNRNIFADTMRRYETAEVNVIDGAILNTYVNTATQSLSRQLQHARYGLGIALLRDGWYCCADQGEEEPFWFDEIDPAIANIGEPIDPVQTAAYSDGVWQRRYQNGVVLVNPVANKGRAMQSVPGTLTLARSGGVVTLTWSAMFAHGKVAGDKIRIPECSTDTSFVGTFTITAVTSTSISWAQAGSNVSLSKPTGFFALKSSVDLTGLGYRRILGTDDAHNDYDNGTSLNDGATAGVEELWSGDARIYVKVSSDA